MALEEGQIMVEDAQILFRNFEGVKKTYNEAGNRNFCLVLPPELDIEAMKQDGWNVKYLKPRDEEDEPKPYIQVNVKFGFRPPKIVMITSKGRTEIDESVIEMVDWVDIRTVDVIINPSKWDVKGERGIKGYLKSMYITIQEDPLEQKYADINEIEGGSDALQITSGREDVVDAEVME